MTHWIALADGPWWPRTVVKDFDGERIELERPNFRHDRIGEPPKKFDTFLIIPCPKHFWQRWLLRLARIAG